MIVRPWRCFPAEPLHFPGPSSQAKRCGSATWGRLGFGVCARVDASVLTSPCAALAQVPLLRTSYRRTAFQLSTDNLVRVSLDSDLAMSAEAPTAAAAVAGTRSLHDAAGASAPVGGGAAPWCRDFASRPLAAREVVHFPYAVVEVKLQAKAPDWLNALVQCGLLLAVPKFSKFLHGTALLYQDRAGERLNSI